LEKVGIVKTSFKKRGFIVLDPKPSDLFMIRLKLRKKEGRIEPVSVETASDELWIGVKG